MIRIIVTLTLCLYALCVYTQNKGVDFLLSKLYDRGKSNYVMIIAHRGNWRNAPENSLQAFQQCIDAGFDGVEIDVQMTKDSAIVIMHDDTLDRTTTGTGKVSDWTLEQLKTLHLKSPIGIVTRQRIPTLEEVLDLCKGKILIQVDKWQPIQEKVVEIIKQKGCERQTIIRSSVTSAVYKQKYEKLLKGFIYSPVVVCNGNNDEERTIDLMNHVVTPMISLSFKSDNYPILNHVDEIKKRGFRIWYNSLWATFNGGHDDELAIENPDASYGWLLEHGANIIFSDNPFQLLDYLTKQNRR